MYVYSIRQVLAFSHWIIYYRKTFYNAGFPDGLVVKNLPANAGASGDEGLIPGSGGSPGEGNGNPFQYSCLQNPMDRGAWRAVVHRVTKSWTQLKQLNMHATLCTYWQVYYQS